jgi:hypothetical protein
MNPELRRYLWLEMSPQRRLAAPAVLLAIFALFAAGGDAGEDWRERLYRPASVLTFVILFLWGTREAAESVVEEVRERTWDLQRLSALGPWEMTVGKLFGAPVFTWYAGALCLAATAVASLGMARPLPVSWLVLATVGGAVTIHGAAIALSLQAVRRETRASRRFGVLFLLLPILLLMVGLFPFSDVREMAKDASWYGFKLERAAFFAGSATAFAGWAVLGAYRSFCRELQVRTLPWAWPAFALFTALWLTGFSPADVGFVRAFTGVGLLACLGATYLAFFSEPTTAMGLRRVATAWGRGDRRRALQELPVWPTTLVLAFLFALAAPFVFAGVGQAFDLLPARQVGDFVTRAPFALALAAARDGAILVFFASAARPRRVEGSTLLCLALLWWVIPGLLSVMGLGDAAAVVNPFLSWSGTTAAVVMGVQAAIAAWLAAARWRRHYGRPARA